MGWGQGSPMCERMTELSRIPRPPQAAQAGARLKLFTESTLFMKNVALAENCVLGKHVSPYVPEMDSPRRADSGALLISSNGPS